MTKIAILGASAAGCTLAMFLRKLDYEIDIYERRADIRHVPEKRYQSLAISLSTRGLRVLDSLGLGEEARRIGVPIQGRMIHSSGGKAHVQPYGLHNHLLYCMSRNELTKLLLDEAERNDVQLHFDQKCVDINAENTSISFSDAKGTATRTVRYDLIVGADGVFSFVRESLAKSGHFVADTQEFPVGYRAARLPPSARGESALDPKYLHVWPQRDGFVIALPLIDRTFDMMIFCIFQEDIDECPLADQNATLRLFECDLPDQLALAPDLVERLFERPLGRLTQLRCFPWSHHGRVALVGDAAHATTPFLGQGMNCAFEDCRTFYEAVQKFPNDLSCAMERYQSLRKPNADAIEELSREHFSYLSEFAIEKESIRYKEIEAALAQKHPDFVPLYTLIEFTSIPYSRCQDIGRCQRTLIDRLVSMDSSGAPWESQEGQHLVRTALAELRQLTS